ncbi:hypothetical protein ACFX1T_043452 [Malus domestica]
MGCSFLEEGLMPATLTSLSISFHPNLTTIQGKVLRQLTSLEHLTIKGCPELQGFPEEAPKSLKSLTISDCPNIGREVDSVELDLSKWVIGGSADGFAMATETDSLAR